MPARRNSLLRRCAPLVAVVPFVAACTRSAPPVAVGTASRDAIVEPETTEAKERPRLPHDVVMRAALPFYGLRFEDGAQLSPEGLAEELADADAICIGESHDNPHHHYAQLALLQQLLRLGRAGGRELAVGFEMVQLPFQGALDDWSEGKIDDEEFLEATHWESRWGYDFNLYRLLFESARRDGATLLALNARRELTQKIARQGLRGLSDDERNELPVLDFNSEEHRSFFRAAMSKHPMPHAGHRRMYAAQLTWDETMAAVSARWLRKRMPARQIIVIAGSGHCHHSAIPMRIKRRTGARVVSVKPILVRGDQDPCPELAGYDFGVLLQADP